MIFIGSVCLFYVFGLSGCESTFLKLLLVGEGLVTDEFVTGLFDGEGQVGGGDVVHFLVVDEHLGGKAF